MGTKEPRARGPLRKRPLRNLVTELRNQESGTKEPGARGPLRKRESCEVWNTIFEVGKTGTGECQAGAVFGFLLVVPLGGGYPFFAQNVSIEPRSVHTRLMGLVGVPRAKREAVAPHCAAWGQKPAVARG